MMKILFFLSAVLFLAPLPAFAQAAPNVTRETQPPADRPKGAKVPLGKVSESDQKKLNEALQTDEKDAKVKIKPIGESDKENVNSFIRWLEDLFGLGTGKPKAKPETKPKATEEKPAPPAPTTSTPAVAPPMKASTGVTGETGMTDATSPAAVTTGEQAR